MFNCDKVAKNLPRPSPYRMKSQRLALVISEFFLRRLTPTLAPYIRGKLEYRIIDIHRPLREVRESLLDLDPTGIITEWIPRKTEDLLSLGVPTVIADCDTAFPNAVSIDVDDWAIGREAARFFLRNGYDNFAYYSIHTQYADQRRDGFGEELALASKTFAHYQETYLNNKNYLEYRIEIDDALQSWLASLPKPVAIFAAHDPLGRHICEACSRLGLRVPEDVAVVGVNNDELICSLSHPMLSSIEVPWDRIGLAVGEAIMELLTSPTVNPGPRLIAPGTVVRRQSTDLVASQDPQVRRALGFMQNRFREDVTVESMCGQLNICRRSLERRFADQLGRTPWEMLCHIRVDTAKSLLVNANHSIAQIAEMSGFSNAERFCVVFKRLTGKRPSDFRQPYLAKTHT